MPLRGPFSAGDEPEWLERYLSGECTAAESACIEHWAADPANAATLAAARRAWEATGPLPQRFSPDMALRAMRQRAHPTVPHTRPQGVGGGRTWHVTAIVVSVVAVVSSGLGVGIARHRAGLRAAAGREYATAAGQRLSVTLVDGTQLTLAPASRVRITADYGQRTGGREVELEGEAYFAVVHDAAHPFAVRAHGAVARDVGTAFDMRAYPEDAGAKVAVAEGAVTVTAASRCRTEPATGGPCGAEARAGDVATVANGGVAVAHRGDLTAYLAWRQGGLVFEATPLRDAVRDLARMYDLNITVADSALLGMRITTSVGQEPVDDVLASVTFALGAQYERMGRRVVIRRQGAASGRDPDHHLPAMQTARAREPGA